MSFNIFNDTATTKIYTLSLHDALPISFSTTFLHRPEQQLSFLQVGRRVNAAKFDVVYRTHRTRYAEAVTAPIAVECVDRKSTRLNSSHANISYAAFCLQKKTSIPLRPA